MRAGLSWLDFKLGLRMLVRYPTLTVVGGLAMAFAISVGVATFELIQRATNPTLPLPDGDRIVGLTYWDVEEGNALPPTAYDFLAWRESVRTVQDVGGFRLLQRNLGIDDATGEPVGIAQISAAAFRVTRVPPLLGRTLVEADEVPGAPPVLLVGHRLWQTRFGGDPAVVGRVVRLAGAPATVVGVMPEGYEFPMSHQAWIPLRLDARPAQPGGGAVRVFGRLAAGATMTGAQAELATGMARAAAEFPDHYTHLRPQVLPYAASIIFIPPDLLVRAGIHSVNVFAALLLIVICGNVALLMFARAATREREIVVRGALGAGRIRIVGQLFTEALVLGALAALVGVTATNVMMRWVIDAMRGEDLPFWFVGGISATTWTYAILLTLLASAIAGVLPALKITGRSLATGIRESAAGVASLRMGGIWTAFIITQIAATVLFTAVAYVTQRQAAAIASTRTTFPAGEYLAVRLNMDRSATDEAPQTAEADFLRHYTATVRELEQRVAADPAVAGVTLAEGLPLMPSEPLPFEVDGLAAEPGGENRRRSVFTDAVGLEFFDLFQARIVAGRGLTSQDQVPGANTVVVNQLFVERMLQGRNAIGRRIRYVPLPQSRTRGTGVGRGESVALPGSDEPGPWLDIVGVVGNLVPESDAPLRLDNPARPVVYRLLDPARLRRSPLYLAARVRGEPGSLAPALRQIAAGVTPLLRLDDFTPLDQAKSSDARAWRAGSTGILLVSALALFLSMAGIYSVVAFTVARRTREIAIRVALGASAASVVATIFRRPLVQVASGVVLGCVGMGSLVALSVGGSPATIGTLTRHAALLALYGIVMMGVCTLACIGPAVRALRVEPTETLRDDG